MDIMDIHKENRPKGAPPKAAPLFSLCISIVLYLGIMPKCIYQESKLPILEKAHLGKARLHLFNYNLYILVVII